MNDRIALSEDLPELTPDLFTSGTAIIGIRGSGKTNGGVVITEQAIAYGVPAVVVDPTGVWWGLKSSADGNAPGLPVYVFGGAHGDVPLEADAGAVLARFVVERRVPIVLDLSDLSKGAQRRFVGEFSETLYDIKARFRDPLLVVLDEAARFIPQGMVRGDIALAKCIGAVEDMVALGRSRGLGCVLIGQRPATINKNVLTQADNLIAMRTVGAQDRKALDEWVTEMQGDQRERDEMMRNLAALPQGEGYFWSPAIFGIFRRVKYAARTTFDSSRTPKVGEKRVEPTVFASVDLDELRGEIASSVERAKEDDPKALRARIKELEARSGGVEASEILRQNQELNDGLLRAREERDTARAQRDALAKVSALLADAARTSTRAVLAAAEGLIHEIDRINAGFKDVTPLERRPEPAAATSAPAVSTSARESTRVRPADGSGEPGEDKLPGGHRRILEALAMRHPRAMSRSHVGLLAGYSPNSSGFQNYLGAMRTRGLIVYPAPNEVAMTEAGASHIRDMIGRAPKTSAEMLETWAPIVGSAGRVLRVVAQAFPRSMTRDQIAEAVGLSPTSSGFQNYLGKLRGLGLIEYLDAGVVRATDEMMPTGKLR